MALTEVSPIERAVPARMSDEELQATLLRLCAEAMQLYTGNTNGRAPERVIQCYVWDKLVSLGLVAMVEVPKGCFDEWEHVTLDQQQHIDLLIYDPSADGNPDNATLRAIVEFKRQIWNEAPRADIERTARAMAKLDRAVLGFCIACLSDFGDHPEYPAEHIEEGERVAAKFGCAISTGSFHQVLSNGTHHYGTVIGLMVPIDFGHRGAH